MAGLVKGKHIFFTTATEDVGTVVTCLLGGNPITCADVRVAIVGAIAVVAVENAPLIVLPVAKNKVHRTVNRGGIGIGAVTIVGHLDTSTGIPVAEGVRTNNVHCCIGMNANESNQH